MADGTFKPIHQVVVGDELMGIEGTAVVWALDRPKLFKGKDQRMIKLNGGKEFMTDNHPVMTKDGWKAVYPEMAEREDYDALQGKVGQLEVGDEIITADGSMLVESIEVLEHDGNERRLYNLLVSGDNAYFANNILAHGAKMDAQGRFPLARDHDGEPEPVASAAA
ncbi:Hint domain-containing protein [Sulfitobacter sp. R18_1]|uniref:Hint domain-containing protein n=1 Tax=Sulfitobacter sp. R18_1 TaxID=2821104 RepID=UPI001ADCE4DF|nr:Hint domain-containing protein [Sulfitobacter sp. R18_1]